MIITPPPDTTLLRGPTQLARLFMRRFVGDGDLAVDATCGNGHDTLLLAELVGTYGRVWAFDVQDEAIRSTSDLLERNGFSDRVKLIKTGHEHMAEHVPAPVRAIIFNLGYRPGGNRDITTGPDTTLAALSQALQLLMPEGVLVATVYPGHPGGAEEATAVSNWLSALAQRSFQVWRMAQANAAEDAPYFFLMQKAA